MHTSIEVGNIADLLISGFLLVASLVMLVIALLWYRHKKLEIKEEKTVIEHTEEAMHFENEVSGYKDALLKAETLDELHMVAYIFALRWFSGAWKLEIHDGIEGSCLLNLVSLSYDQKVDMFPYSMICRSDLNVRVNRYLPCEPEAEQETLWHTFVNFYCQRTNELRLGRNAETDELTGLWRRRYFIREASKELDRTKRYPNHVFSIMYFDVDDFAEINNGPGGHAAGDRVLIEIAQVLQHHHRTSDTVARYGGDEFACLLPESGLEDSRSMARIIRKEIKKLGLRISIGISTFEKGMSIEEMIDKADRAMYAEKRRHKRNQSQM